MCHHCIVGDTHGNPHDALAARTTARHLEDPRLIGIAHRERLARAAEAVLLGKARHHSDGLARRAGALQAQVHERAVVDDTRVINQFLTSLERRFADSHLPLVDVASDQVGLRSLGDLPVIHTRVAVINLAHRASRMLPRLVAVHLVARAPRVDVVGAQHRAVGTRLLAHEDARAGFTIRQAECHGRQQYQKSLDLFHIHYHLLGEDSIFY